MERILASGIGLNRIAGMDDYLLGIIETNPEVASMKVMDNAENVQAYASQETLQDHGHSAGSGQNGTDAWPFNTWALMSGISISQGLVVLGLGYMVFSILFLFLAREGSQAKK